MWWRLRQDKVTLAAAAVILCIVLSAVLAPYLAPYNPAQGSIRKRLAPIGTPGYRLGTDEQGRDMLSRLLYGGRLSLTAGVVPAGLFLVSLFTVPETPRWLAKRSRYDEAMAVLARIDGVRWQASRQCLAQSASGR